MQITLTYNHGKPRWRVNVQSGSYRKRLFFTTREEAVAFAAATGGPARYGHALPPPAPLPPARPLPVPAPVQPRPLPPAPPQRPAPVKPPQRSLLESFLAGESWGDDAKPKRPANKRSGWGFFE